MVERPGANLDEGGYIMKKTDKIFRFSMSLFLILSLCLGGISGCSSKQTEDQNEIIQEETQHEEIRHDEEFQNVPERLREMYEVIRGNLELSAEETKEVIGLLQPVFEFQQQNRSQDDPEFKNASEKLSNLLNRYTKRQFESKKEELEKTKKIMDAYLGIGINEILDHQNEPLVTYDLFVENGQLIAKDKLAEKKIKNETRLKEIWESITAMIPETYLKSISLLNVREQEIKKGATTAASISPVDNHTFCLNININLPLDGALCEMISHEFGHMISLGDSQRKPQISAFEALSSEGFNPSWYHPDAYFRRFMEETKEYILYILSQVTKNEEKYLYYLRYKNNYVSMYSTKNPSEDFAESFAHFVKGDTPNTGLAKNKINFFSKFAEFLEIKQRVEKFCKLKGFTLSSELTP
ncbi:MAG: putative zinc-binding metallopeptidase [Oscillospiraceae bacterium]|nr:putative zinc-binding metallopeptidase [Oscillospiraceae bacterium]